MKRGRMSVRPNTTSPEKWEWQRTHIPDQVRRGEFTVGDDGWLSYFDENGYVRFWDGPVSSSLPERCGRCGRTEFDSYPVESIEGAFGLPPRTYYLCEPCYQWSNRPLDDLHEIANWYGLDDSWVLRLWNEYRDELDLDDEDAWETLKLDLAANLFGGPDQILVIKGEKR